VCRVFFTSLDHRWLVRFLEHRIADKRVLRLIQKWMAAGVIEDGAWTASAEGVPQAASASPLLANVYLHVCPERRSEAMEKVVWWIHAVPVMEEGPPGSPCRRGAQTTVMSCRSMPGWEAITETAR
jgi:retron-type reverse transcriptase